MSAYVDLELAQALTIVQEGLLDIERKLEKIKRNDLLSEDRKDEDSIQNATTWGIILAASDEPYAIVAMEDVWVQADLFSSNEEQEVAKAAYRMLRSPAFFTVTENGNVVRKPTNL